MNGDSVSDVTMVTAIDKFVDVENAIRTHENDLCVVALRGENGVDKFLFGLLLHLPEIYSSLTQSDLDITS